MTVPFGRRLPAPTGATGARPAAPIAHRVAARITDWVIVALVAHSFNIVWAPTVLEIDQPGVFEPIRDYDATLALMTVVVIMLWEILWLLAEGATPGKQLFGLYVLDPTSHRGTVEPEAAVRRNVHRLLLILPFGWIAVALSSGASLVLMQDDETHRPSLMDRIARTTVHRLPPRSPRWTPWLGVFLVVLIGGRAVAFVIHRELTLL